MNDVHDFDLPQSINGPEAILGQFDKVNRLPLNVI
jgi:hypothetical protein